jgi:hypothetical protein
MKLSECNQIRARVTSINTGAAIANVDSPSIWFWVVCSAQPMEPFTNRD